jgi:hypothetical protein
MEGGGGISLGFGGKTGLLAGFPRIYPKSTGFWTGSNIIFFR